jgi:translation elongation factor P/translation initiation factor 5A
MATVSDLSKGNYVRYNGEVAQVEEMQHRTPGNLRAFYQIKMRNVRNGKVAENRFRPGEEIEILRVEKQKNINSSIPMATASCVWTTKLSIRSTWIRNYWGIL